MLTDIIALGIDFWSDWLILFCFHSNVFSPLKYVTFEKSKSLSFSPMLFLFFYIRNFK